MLYQFQKELERSMKLSKEEHLTILACIFGMTIMMIESKYSTNDEKDAVLSLLIVPVLMLLYARYLFKKNEK